MLRENYFAIISRANLCLLYKIGLKFLNGAALLLLIIDFISFQWALGKVLNSP
jgi:hypothetical protein